MKESEDAEKRRRFAWEREQEDKLAQVREENERKFRTMQGEIDSLREYIRHFESGTTTTSITPQRSAPDPPRDSTPFQDLPQDQRPNHDASYPMFVQGSSTGPTPYQDDGRLGSLADMDDSLSYTRKRTTSPSSGDDESSEDGELLNTPRPSKRINGHDTRCLTIQVHRVVPRRWILSLIVGLFEQHAMRSHLNRLMSVTEDDPLPTNHIEGAPLADDEPVRFIWAKTIKKSQHNTRMKKRVINDLTQNRELYEHVPQNDFTPENLDVVFDQTFSTLRNRYKAQTDANVAQRRKEKEINKMIKTRRANRKRAVSVLDVPMISGRINSPGNQKLELRTACRERNESYSHPTFDGAFQLECMSSEESEDGSVSGDQPQPRSSGRAPKSAIIRVRGLGWRSSRLVKFFHILDEAGQNDPALSSTLPRGDKGKQKMTGETKDRNRAGAFVLPPKGISSWMISRRWVRRANLVHGDLGSTLRGLIIEHPGFDWRVGTVIPGPESDAEEESRYHMQQYNSSSSLQYALAHP